MIDKSMDNMQFVLKLRKRSTPSLQHATLESRAGLGAISVYQLLRARCRSARVPVWEIPGFNSKLQ